jgi:hypothetical protein
MEKQIPYPLDSDQAAWVALWLTLLDLHGWGWVLHNATIVQYCRGQLSDGTESN